MNAQRGTRVGRWIDAMDDEKLSRAGALGIALVVAPVVAIIYALLVVASLWVVTS